MQMKEHDQITSGLVQNACISTQICQNRIATVRLSPRSPWIFRNLQVQELFQVVEHSNIRSAPPQLLKQGFKVLQLGDSICGSTSFPNATVRLEMPCARPTCMPETKCMHQVHRSSPHIHCYNRLNEISREVLGGFIFLGLLVQPDLAISDAGSCCTELLLLLPAARSVLLSSTSPAWTLLLDLFSVSILPKTSLADNAFIQGCIICRTTLGK
ncbi:hypothetical protein BDZ45DRAFT_29614 [Acephala macrosclerotiorum]|nr:hypothetical protein BDZ45DRAFT_29614 [Acephala macrosclerotiorum]